MTEKRPQRRWYQFSLRTLLITVLLVSLPLSWFGAKLEKKRRERRLISEIGRLCTCTVDCESGESSSTTIAREPGWLQKLLGNDFFLSIERVSLDNVSDRVVFSNVARLVNLSNVRDLHISVDRDFLDDPLVYLQGCISLEELSVDCRNVTDVSLVYVMNLENLRRLSLSRAQITDEGLLQLQSLRSLESLDIRSRAIRGTGLCYLSKLPYLRDLSMSYCFIEDEAMQAAGTLRNIESLILVDNRFTDAGLVHLEPLTNLRRLDLWRNRITPEGVERLQGALPDCQIVY